MKKIFYLLASLSALLAVPSCNKFLDTMPDNRTELDTEEKIAAMLAYAYSRYNYSTVTQFMSDDMDNNAAVVSGTPARFFTELWTWSDVTETNNADPRHIWEGNWSAIACANQALEAIDEMGGPMASESLSQSYGEALLCRAYAHFTLVNVFCMHYNKQTSSTDLGIPYMESPEAGLDPKYDRGNVADVYAKIDRDIQEGLKYVPDSYDVAPKYHFTRQAAYAFAAKFYLFYEKWELAVKYATDCLGASPALRDYSDLMNNYVDLPTSRRAYASSDNKCNLLIQTGMTDLARYYLANYSGAYKYYGYTRNISDTEGLTSSKPWSDTSLSFSETDFRWPPKYYTSSALIYVLMWKADYEFEYTDPVAGRGYSHIVYVPLTTDETLLVRAEAYTMLKQYQLACDDLNTWANNFYSPGVTLTPESITAFYSGLRYYEWDSPTQKKHLNPAFEIDPEGSTQESMLQMILNFRRTEKWGDGERWFDIKRYGIEIYRRVVDSAGRVVEEVDFLPKDDLRRAVQVPQRCIDAGLEPNPRITAKTE